MKHFKIIFKISFIIIFLISCNKNSEDIVEQESFIIVNGEKSKIENAFWFKNNLGGISMIFLNGSVEIKEGDVYLGNNVVKDRLGYLEINLSINNLYHGDYNFPIELKHLYGYICISSGGGSYPCNDYVNITGVHVDKDKVTAKVQIKEGTDGDIVIDVNADDGNNRKISGFFKGKINQLILN
ncbi:hypothetical protein [uncultured Tenacibaculum sp.]|uniref:hypothetical protein n=1 Tax=uncultured Tenacibaculum sp. TaxID=174713 RepID=UPI00261EA8C1|nr:hypothetical protein [uncultured Tenacibaculum sp.]